MTHSPKSPEVNSIPINLGNDTVHLANGITCPQCGVTLRAIDAEPLKPGIRLICRNNHFIFSFGPAR